MKLGKKNCDYFKFFFLSVALDHEGLKSSFLRLFIEYFPNRFAMVTFEFVVWKNWRARDYL